jgi:Activator of Hsp90 ATPase homolog 1-like protein
MTEETRANTRITGTLQSVDGRGVVRMEGRYDTDIDDLWSALTDAPRLARWIAEVEGDLRLGGAFRATFTSGWEGSGRVDASGRARHRRRPDEASGRRAWTPPGRTRRTRSRLAGSP